MSWFANLAKTYGRLSEIVGKPDAKGNVLLPPCHMAVNTEICVTINDKGEFLRAEKSKENIIIPCTDDSASRSGKAIFPHPLHDQIGYLIADKSKRVAYLSQLEKWKGSHKKVNAVYKYVAGGTLINDLRMCDLKTDSKLFVSFSVETTLDDLISHLWKDDSVAEAWQTFCRQTETEDKTLCYVTGELAVIRTKHPKGINPSVNGAKVISCNDDKNYTYRGRFAEPDQANAIGAKASHSAHAMLRYLISTQGYKCGSQAIVAWAVDDGSAAFCPIADSYGIYDNDHQTELDKVIEAQSKVNDKHYAKMYSNAINGIGNITKLNEGMRQIAVIAVDAATTGRMAVTFYKDLPENEYTKRIKNWHEQCCWWFRYKGVEYLSAPRADRIIAAVYGELKGKNNNQIKKLGRERILHCIINSERINSGWLASAVQRVSNPFSYSKQEGGWDKNRWENAISVTCAIARKYFIDKKEEFSLELDKTCNDRSYLYGRLLAIGDAIEGHARSLQIGREDTDKRPTNAVRYMAAFATRPFRTW